MLEALFFGIIFYLVYQVSDITEMKRPSQASVIDTPSTQRRLLAASNNSVASKTHMAEMIPPKIVIDKPREFFSSV